LIILSILEHRSTPKLIHSSLALGVAIQRGVALAFLLLPLTLWLPTVAFGLRRSCNSFVRFVHVVPCRLHSVLLVVRWESVRSTSMVERSFDSSALPQPLANSTVSFFLSIQLPLLRSSSSRFNSLLVHLSLVHLDSHGR
jgi:hypothetical protein